MNIDIVITGKDNEIDLIATLNSCLKLKEHIENVNIYYVDGSSTDHSVVIADRMGAIVLISQSLTGGALRNLGYSRSKGKYILFLSVGFTINPIVFLKALDMLENNPNLGSVWAPACHEKHQPNNYQSSEKIDEFLEGGYSREFLGGIIIKKSILDEVGRYREDLLMGFDTELSYRIRERKHSIFVIYNLIISEKKMKAIGMCRDGAKKGYVLANINHIHRDFKRDEVKEIIICGTSILIFSILSIIHHYFIFLVLISIFKPILFTFSYKKTFKLNLSESLFYSLCRSFNLMPIYIGFLNYYLILFLKYIRFLRYNITILI